MTVITRFAPSPTGRLHVGNLRTAMLVPSVLPPELYTGILFLCVGGGRAGVDAAFSLARWRAKEAKRS